MNFLEIIIPILITLALTFFIGLERQNIGKSAGITAHVFIAVASCSMALLQHYMYIDSINSYNEGIIQTVESQRIIAQVITGIGFLGAGVIMKDKDHISGLTTATTLFSSAAIGLIIGSNYYLLGIILGIVLIVFLYGRDIFRGLNPFKKIKKDIDL